MKVTYSENYQPNTLKYKAIWFVGNILGINVIRIRSTKNRYEFTKGNTFSGVHVGKVSFYKELTKPYKELWFKKFVKLGETNHTMKVLEVNK
tara:strand:+ start:235 stop:510 length:276 start_codon:yes stop_codon:yes gene_type:complete